jgi:hypothetical protein
MAAAALTDNEIKNRLLDYCTTTEADNIMAVPPSQVGIGDKINTPEGLLQGIDVTLNNPHLYPQSTRGTHTRQAPRQFWATDCPFKNIGITWGVVVQTALWHLWRISLALPDTQVMSHWVLFGGNSGTKADDAIKIMRNQYPTHTLWTILFGADNDYPMDKPCYAKTITHLREPRCTGWVHPDSRTRLQMAHAGYFIPLVHNWLRFMNIGSHSTLKRMIQAKIYNLVKDQSKGGKTMVSGAMLALLAGSAPVTSQKPTVTCAKACFSHAQ